MSGVATGLRRNLSMTIALVLSTAISLAFLGGALLFGKLITEFKTIYEDKINVSIYLCTASSNQSPGSNCRHKVTDVERRALQVKLQADGQIAQVDYLTEAQATAIAKQRLGAQVVDEAGPGAIPSSFTLKLKDLKNDYPAVAARYAKEVGVDGVQNQDDSLKTMLNLFGALQKASFAVAALILIAAIILMSNTIQVAAAQRKNETGIMRLVGATRWMTQLPFIIEAVIAAVVGGVIAIVLLAFGKRLIFDAQFGDQVSRGVLPRLQLNDVIIAGGLPLLIGVALAAVTAWGTLRLYVKI